MKATSGFLVGFAAGWLSRSAVDSSRSALVSSLAGVFGVLEWVRRTLASEREFLSDLVAEARSQVHMERAAATPAAFEPDREARA